jgi:hypothetical protein
MVLPSGTALEVIKRDTSMSYVRTASGASGWVDNSYLAAEAVSSELVSSLRAKNASLEAQLKLLQDSAAGSPANADAQLAGDYAALQQQFREERLKVGELEVTIAELRKRQGQNADSDALYREIDTLRAANRELEIRLAGAGGPAATSSDPAGAGSFAAAPPAGAATAGGIRFSWQNLLILVGVLLVIGLTGGIYLMDFLNRRRHGGFRI